MLMDDQPPCCVADPITAATNIEKNVIESATRGSSIKAAVFVASSLQ